MWGSQIGVPYARACGRPSRRSPRPARSGMAGCPRAAHRQSLTRFVSGAALVLRGARPGRVLGVGLVLAALGWGLDTQTQVQTDIAKLAPQSLSSSAQPERARTSDRGGRRDRPDGRAPVPLTKPATIEWMSRYESAMLNASATAKAKVVDTPNCAPPSRCRTSSSPKPAPRPSSPKSRSVVLLAAIPTLLLPGRDQLRPSLGHARLRHPLDAAAAAATRDRRDAGRPASAAARVSAHLVGLSVLAAQAGAQIASPWRRVLTLLVALAAVAIILLIAFRGQTVAGRSCPLAPIVLATGWSALVLVRVAHTAQPDVGHARCARDRDLHRVQRAALRAPTPGASRRSLHRAGLAPRL